MATQRVYRPATLVRMRIRLEDFTNDAEPDADEGDPVADRRKVIDNKIRTLRKQLGEVRAAAVADNPADQATVAQFQAMIRKQIRAKQALEANNPVAKAQDEEPGDPHSVDILSIPMDMTFEANGFRQADTVSLTLPFIDAPFPSQIIRAALLEVWLGTIPAENFAQPETWRLSFTRGVLRFRGYVDDWETMHGEEDAVVSLKARSLEAVLMDTRINALARPLRLKTSSKISAYVDQVLSNVPGMSGKTSGDRMRSRWINPPARRVRLDDPNLTPRRPGLGGISESGVLDLEASTEPKLDARTLRRSLQTAKSRNKALGSTPGSKAPPAPPPPPTDGTEPGQREGTAKGTPSIPPQIPTNEMSAWDLIVQACNLVGCVPQYEPSIDPDNILLRPPSTLYETTDGGVRVEGGGDGFEREFIDPRTGRVITSQVRIMVWGHNIKSMSTNRKLGRIKAPTIEIRSYNDDAEPSKQTIIVRYPETPRSTRIGSKGEGGTNEVKVFRGDPIRDPKLLKQRAIGLYHSLSRQEIGVKIETDELSSYIDPRLGLDHNEEAMTDLLALRAGTPLRVMVARQLNDQVSVTPLVDVFEKRPEEIKRLLVDQAYRFRPATSALEATDLIDKAVQRIGDALAGARMTDTFYVRNVSFRFSAEDGMSLTIQVVNFIEARALPSSLSTVDALDDEGVQRPDAGEERRVVANERADRALGGFG